MPQHSDECLFGQAVSHFDEGHLDEVMAESVVC
jgi:hypothetical protein